MKNLIDPKILATFKVEPVPVKEIVNFLDSNDNIKTTYLCKLIGIPPRIIYDYRTYQKIKMKKSKANDNDILPKSASKRYNRYNAEEKFSLANKYITSDDQGKSELLRKYGIYQSDIMRWWEQIRMASLETLGKRKVRSDKKSDEQLKIDKLEKELREQEQTTAKLSTLLVLQKKTFDILKKQD